MRSVTAVN